jgi:DNA invertase Pin-like site-specific DNA recombinase
LRRSIEPGQFRSLCEAIDTFSATGRRQFHTFASLAAFERELLIERTQEGLAAVRVRGRVGGRPRAPTPEQAKVAHTMNADGSPVTTIADVLHVPRATINRELAGRDA